MVTYITFFTRNVTEMAISWGDRHGINGDFSLILIMYVEKNDSKMQL